MYLLAIAIGTGIYAFGFVAFNMANHLAQGGVAGLSLISYALWHIDPSYVQLLINIPLLMIGYRFLGRRTFIYTIWGIVSLAVWIWIFQRVSFTINIGNDTDRGYNIRIVTGRAESSIKIIFFVEYDKSDMDINPAKSTLQKNVRSILDKTSQYMGLRVDIRISDYFESQLKLPTAIYQTGKHGNAQTDNLVSYPFELEKELTDILGQGIFDNTDVLITKISSELSKNFSDNGYKHMVTELYTVVKRAIIQISPDALMSYADKLCDEVDDEQSFCHFFNELLEYSRNYTSQHSDKNKMLIQKVKAYVEEHYAEEITLDDMADMIGYSTYYFMKLIKEYLGMSFGDFLTSVRMNNAKKLLLSTNMSISEVGYSVGYNDANYFARVFKRQEKITPSEYKKQLQNTSK